MVWGSVVFSIKHDIKFLRTRMMLWIFNFIPDFYSLSMLRNLFLRLGGAQIPLTRAYIRSPLYCTYLRGVVIEDGVFVNSGCRFQGTASIHIGAQSQIGPQCCFETVDHLPSGEIRDLPISVGANSWLGARVIILGGVKIENSVIIGAGAVVTKDVPAGELWGGVPAKLIRKIEKGLG